MIKEGGTHARENFLSGGYQMFRYMSSSLVYMRVLSSVMRYLTLQRTNALSRRGRTDIVTSRAFARHPAWNANSHAFPTRIREPSTMPVNPQVIRVVATVDLEGI